MCDPVTGAVTLSSFMAVAGPVAAVGGTLLSAYGAQQASKAREDTFAYQAAVDRNNQIIEERRAVDALKRGEIEERQQKLRTSQAIAKQTVGLVGQGVDVTFGSSVDLLADTAELGAYDAAVIRGNVQREAAGIRGEAATFGAQATLSRARSEAESPLLAGGATLLTGAGNVAAQWYS